MIKLKQTSGPFGDATCNYEVVVDKYMTVRDFIAEVLKNEREWGYVRIGKNFFGNIVCKYNKGKIEFLDESIDTNRTIKSGLANGGWNRMDYSLEIEK